MAAIWCTARAIWSTRMMQADEAEEWVQGDHELKRRRLAISGDVEVGRTQCHARFTGQCAQAPQLTLALSAS